MPEAIDLTVIVPAYNEAAGLARVLAPLAEACAERGWRVMVVDDGTRTTPPGWCANWPPGGPGAQRGQPGYGAALKRGVRLAKSEWVATSTPTASTRWRTWSAWPGRPRGWTRWWGRGAGIPT